MKTKSTVLLLLAAAIWGFAFVAQRVGMEHVGPFTFNGVRFAVGCLSLLPLIGWRCGRAGGPAGASGLRAALPAGLAAGAVLFVAASLQQIGLQYTTAGKAAFVTCLYIVLVPIAGVFLGRRLPAGAWLGALLATVGLYLLCAKAGFALARGDALELAGALFWTGHILLIDRFSRKTPVLQLALVQFITCSALSLACALACEPLAAASLLKAAVPILYGGIFSVGIAYTLQILGQRGAPPAHAAILLSMETVFAALGGGLLLGERLGWRELSGCALMLAGMLLSQLQVLKNDRAQRPAGGTEPG